MAMRRLLSLIAGCCMAIAPSAARASEPAQAFLDALRERGLHDVALDYLDSVANNPSVPAAFKETLVYEKGVTLISGAKFQRDTVLREKQLDDGHKTLQQFITSQPTHLLAVAARSQLGNVIVERARIKVERGKKSAGDEKERLNTEAQGLYGEAAKVFAALVEELRARLKSYPAALDPKKDAKKIDERDRFRMDFLQAQLLVAATREEMSDTYPRDSKEWTAAVTTAMDEYKTIYQDYRTRLAGLYARMYQGRCLQKLKKDKEASAIFNELLSNPDTPDAFRTLKIKVSALACDSWLAQSLPLEILKKSENGLPMRPLDLVNTARANEEREDEMCALRLGIAKAAKMRIDELTKTAPRDTSIRLLVNEGKKQLSELSRFANPYQDEARRLLPQFSGGTAEVSTEQIVPKNFVEARNAAREAIEAMQAANLQLKSLPARIAQAKYPERGELEAELEKALAQAKKSQGDALYYCRHALEKADKDSPLDDVNLIRYLLCYLAYAEENYFDAVVIGNFLARRYPDSQGARPCANIVLASYLKLYAANMGEDKEFESSRVVDIADYIVKKWPDQPEAEQALNTLIPFMIRARQLKQAEDYLAKIPDGSPHRGNAELKTGQALWASYLEGSKQLRDWESSPEIAPEGFDAAARKVELEPLKTKAKQTLVNGVDRMKGTGELSAVLVSAVLSLAQIYVDTNEPLKCVGLLEEPKIGLLTLLKNNDPLVLKEGYPEEIYKTALRAYISSLSAGADAKATVEKAREIMDALKQRMGQTTTGQARLVAIYVSLAKDLQQQMEIAEPATKSALGKAFEGFLSQVAAEATELNILNWVAETYRGMGESYGGTFQTLPAEARSYLEKAVATYQKILDLDAKSPNFVSDAMATQLRVQMAKANKTRGKFIEARDTYEAVLKSNAMLLPVQIEAARLYQEWGGTGKGQEQNFEKAMFGDRPDARGKNVIWGWGAIAGMTANKAEFRDQFIEARYNLALCRYNFAISRTDAAKKQEQITLARRDITNTVAFYPNLGDKWRPQFENLLKSIQKALGERQAGLQTLQTPATPTAAPATATAAPAGKAN